MTLSLLMAALLVAAGFWLTHPLFTRAKSTAVARRTANVLAHQTRLAEIHADVIAGVLPSAEAEPLRRELDARLVEDAAAGGAEPAAAATGKPLLAIAIALAMLAFAAAWYWQAGSWRVAQQIAGGPAAVPSDAEVEGMVARLAERLASQPDDAEGWAMLGRSYFVMGRHADAAKAYGEANQRAKSPNADWLVGEGEALAMSRDRDLLGSPAQLFERALTLTPDDSKALWYGALADAQAQNLTRAAERLRRLLAQDPPAELRAVISARLDELQTRLGSAGAQTPKVSSPAAAASAEGMKLVVQVSLASSLRDQLPANATLFVFAKAASGPPMPLAVQKLAGARLPLTVTLDDSMAMTPAMKLSQFDRYVITARLSVSGNAQSAAGDLEGRAEASRGTASVVPVEIDRVLP